MLTPGKGAGRRNYFRAPSNAAAAAKYEQPIPYLLTASARPIPFRIPWFVAGSQVVASLFDREGGQAVEQRQLRIGKENSPRL